MTAQEEFDSTYITSIEICKTLLVTRASIVNATRRGLLPEPIHINKNIHLWKREDVVFRLEAWKLSLQSRRGELVA